MEGATEQQLSILNNQNLAGANITYTNALSDIVQYNLNTVEPLLLIVNRCTVEPLKQSRKVIEDARDAGLVCLQNFANSLSAETEFQNCIQTMTTTSRASIDTIKSTNDNCFQNQNAM